MRFALGARVLLMNALDNTTTFLCLRSPVTGFDVFEANPVARWLFDQAGLFEGLVLEMALSTAAVLFLVMTHRIPRRSKFVLLTLLALLPTWAVANNVQVMYEVGIGLGGR